MSEPEAASPPRHMSPDEFRAAGHAMVDFIADYWGGVESMPVLSQAKPGDLLAALPSSPPQSGQAWEEIASDVPRLILPGLTHWQHPSFFAFFPANSSGPGVLGELLSAGLGVNGMLWATSPAATELETRMLDWMAEMLDLPGKFRSGGSSGGVIQGTASEATLVALLAAKQRARRSGRAGAFTLYASTQAHSSIVKAAMIAGLADGPEDRRHVRLIEVDDAFAMRADLLEAAIRDDLTAGRVPGYVCASVGTTSSTAVDSLGAIGPIARRHGLWLHVDAAHAGAACVCPEFRWILEGVGHADSVAFNPHKWLLTNFDCNLMWTADRESLTGALSITPEYLRNKASDGAGTGSAVIDYRDWQIPLGRRFRALKLWFVIRHYGVEGLRAHVREHVRLAAEFESWVRSDGRFEVVAPRTINLVCFRLRGPKGESANDADVRNRALLEAVNATGRVYLTHTVLPGVGYVLRMCIGGTQTRAEHVGSAWDLIRSAAGTASARAAR